MTHPTLPIAAALLAAAVALSACGRSDEAAQEAAERNLANTDAEVARRERAEGGTIWDLFEGRDDPNATMEVNKYLWVASLDVLDFLPVESADPFTGIISTGYGVPPGGTQAYRATIRVHDPALDARSLNVALQTRAGPVASETATAVEDAILTRARQLRLADGRL